MHGPARVLSHAKKGDTALCEAATFNMTQLVVHTCTTLYGIPISKHSASHTVNVK